MPTADTAYSRLEERFRRINALEQATGVLDWDRATMMPDGGAEARTNQLTALEVTCHELLTHPEVGDWLDEAEATVTSAPAALNDWQRANLTEMRREWRHASAVDADLVAAITEAEGRCEMIWREARPNSDFEAVRPALQTLLDLTRQMANAKAEAFGCSPYDALLDGYEPGGASAEIDRLFDDLAAFLPGFLSDVLDAQAARGEAETPQGPFPIAAQAELGRRLMAAVGFEFAHGRLDVSHHPFCGGVPDDVRITTRYDESDFASALMAVLHETGHALYERGLPGDWRLQPVGQARGMAMHESQSLLVEMQACRSPHFLAFLAPLAREAFDGQGPAWEADNLHRLWTRVQPDFIRVDADEVTYPAHVILRYRLERQLLGGALDLAELPAAWNEGMVALLGIRPPDDRLGCLQDIHWFSGAWGYFPTYTLGAMTAAQLYQAAEESLPQLSESLREGDFHPLMQWLRETVHSQGSRLSGDALITAASGRSLDPEVFKAHLRRRYLDA